MSSEKVGFAGSSQGLLVGVLERPDHAPLQALAVFAHCFTCGKNSLAATRISRALAQQGIATLRFDFTGLGESEGDFGRGGFSSSVADIVAAVHWMQSTIGMPALLVGHSLGGTAAIAAAARLDGIRAVCTLGAPATADHVLRHFGPTKSEEDGQIQNRFSSANQRLMSRYLYFPELTSRSRTSALQLLRSISLSFF
ncbi:alpha/beta fold hydrolase, partial [Aeromonas caviae]|nr:alpha/beta fold hydrolase [Aeromonas caviae]